MRMSDEELKRLDEKLELYNTILRDIGVETSEAIPVDNLFYVSEDEIDEVMDLTEKAIKGLIDLTKFDEDEGCCTVDTLSRRVLRIKELLDLKLELRRWKTAKRTLNLEFNVFNEEL